MTARLLTMFLLIFSNLLFSQGSEDSVLIRKIANEVLSGSTAYENLRKLTKEVGGRLAGLPQMYMAENWAMDALKEAGAEKVWKQECKVPRWVRGPAETAYFTTSNKQKVMLDVLALGNSVGTGSKLLSAPVILINSFDELQRWQTEIRGKIVFYNYAFRSDFIKTFQSYSDVVKYRGQGPSMAARHGAIGVIVRSMTHAADNNPHTGGTNYNDSFPGWLPLFFPYGISELNPSGGGADIGPLNRQLGTAVAGLQPDSQRYFDIHHARSDVFEAVNKRELELGALNMAALIYLVDKYGL